MVVVRFRRIPSIDHKPALRSSASSRVWGCRLGVIVIYLDEALRIAGHFSRVRGGILSDSCRARIALYACIIGGSFFGGREVRFPAKRS